MCVCVCARVCAADACLLCACTDWMRSVGKAFHVSREPHPFALDQPTV